jgi:pimeloyl-ACP methyl ester carboxylesterase
MAHAIHNGWVTVPVVQARRGPVYGVRTHYLQAGDGEPVVLVHRGGLGGTAKLSWRKVIPGLAEHYRVDAPDLIGHGFTDRPDIEYSFQTLVEHLAGFIDALNLDVVRLVGNSQGAYVALKYACDFPDRVHQVVVMNSSTLASALGQGKALSLQTAARPPALDGSRESLRTFLEAMVWAKEQVTEGLVDTVAQLAQLPGAMAANDSLMNYRALVETPTPDGNQSQLFDLRHRIKLLGVPWCMVWGKNDGAAPIGLAHAIRDSQANRIDLHEVEDAGHEAQNDQPETVLRLILETFAEKRTGGAA